MAEKQLKSIKFHGLPYTYTIPEIDETLSVEGMTADAAAVGKAIGDINEAFDVRYDTLTWDGNTEGLHKIGSHYKVSDAVPTVEDLEKGCVVIGAFPNGATGVLSECKINIEGNTICLVI